jgi:hypothetical protein
LRRSPAGHAKQLARSKARKAAKQRARMGSAAAQGGDQMQAPLHNANGWWLWLGCDGGVYFLIPTHTT